jgi:serine/threonine protein kinase
MASLTHTLHIFQHGDLSHEEFLAQVDQVLETDKTDSAQLMEILTEEHTKFPLPAGMYDEVKRRIEHRGEGQQGQFVDETRMLTEQVRLATPPPSVTHAGVDEAERVKGVGDTLNGRFELKECLGIGGMGTVYKALDLRKLEASDRNPYIAIKVLNVQFRGHPKSLIALQREAKKAQKLAHPNIVTVYDFDRDGSMVYLTMEYLTGQPLNRVLRAPGFSGMPYDEAMRIVEGMAKALTYAHQRGFVHCDFKPANVFLTDSGEVKVIDFGIARVFQRTEEDAEATVFDPGSLGGLTPAYASPEMLEHREPDPRDDIYALACITYELLTGRHPFDRMAATQARNAGLKPQQPQNLSGRKWRALKAALAFERESRTPTVERFLADIKGERSAADSKLVWVGATLGLAVVLAVLINQLFTGERDQPAPPPAAPPVEAGPVAVPAPLPVEPAPEPSLSLTSVMPILTGVPCSAMTAAAQDNDLRVEGYLPERHGVARLRDALMAVPGVKTLTTNLEEVGDDKCAVIDALAPYWTRNHQIGSPAAITTRGERTQLVEGDRLILDLKTPGFDSFVHVDYYVLDGSVVHLVPSPRERRNQAPPNYSATIGSLGSWVIGKPFGKELIVLLVTPEPLFPDLRREAEPRAEYLQAVGKQLQKLADKHGPDRIAVDFVQIITKARKP